MSNSNQLANYSVVFGFVKNFGRVASGRSDAGEMIAFPSFKVSLFDNFVSWY